MATPGSIETITTLFIVAMIWIRTRMQYPRRGTGRLRLERAGWIYFGCVLGMLAIGWLAAPWVGHALWPAAALTPTLARVVWFLTTYFAFIIVHRVLKLRGVAVFSSGGDAEPFT